MQICFGNKAKSEYNCHMGENDRTEDPEISTEIRALHDGFVPGQVLGGKYKVISLLGQGGMGTVYLVQQVFLNKNLALKTLNKVSVTDITLQRFQLEAKAASSLRHPNLVEVHDFGLLDDGQPYLVMDFIQGFSLSDLLKNNGPMSMEDATPIFAQACFGLLAAHEKGIVHRDIKPGNIMLLKNRSYDTDGSVKVVDFGIAKLTSHETGEIQSLTRTGDVFGSPLYMSPEQCSGGLVDHRSDIYSLGCVLFEMLTGTPPYVGQNALSTMRLHESGALASLKEASMGKQFPDALEHIVAKMLSKSPGQRYQNVGLVAHDMASVCKGRAVADLRPAEKVAKPAKIISMNEQRFFLIIALTILLTSVAAGTGGYLYSHSQILPVEHNSNTSNDSNNSNNSIHVNASFASPSSSDQRPNKQAKHGTETASSSVIGDLIDVVAKPVDRVKEELKNFGPIRATLVNGGAEKQFTFPDGGIGSSRGIGQLCEITDRLNHRRICNASGTVRVSAKIPLLLKIQGQNAVAVLDTPSFFSHIDPGEFSGLSLTQSDTDKLFKMSTDESTEEKIEAITKVIAGWSRLEVLMLNNLPVNEAAVANLSKIKRLRHLHLSECAVNESNFAKQPFLNQLKTLTLANMNHADDIVHAVSKSTNLENLELMDTGVDSNTLRELRHLTALGNKEKTISDKIVETILELKQLKSVVLLGELSHQQLRTLAECPHLHGIGLPENYYTANTQRQMKQFSRKIYFMALPGSNDIGDGIIFDMSVNR
jgi:serine/threonine protein kinase